MHNKYIIIFLSIRLMLVTKTAETNKMKWGGNLASKSSQSIGEGGQIKSYKAMCHNRAVTAMCGVPRGQRAVRMNPPYVNRDLCSQGNFTQSHAGSNCAPKSTIIISPNCQIQGLPLEFIILQVLWGFF